MPTIPVNRKRNPRRDQPLLQSGNLDTPKKAAVGILLNAGSVAKTGLKICKGESENVSGQFVQVYEGDDV
jgi:hypothetical protein